MCFLFALIPITPKCTNINIFKVPEAPKEVVPEEKVHPPQKPEVVLVKGTSLTLLQGGIGRAMERTALLAWEVPLMCECNFCLHVHWSW